MFKSIFSKHLAAYLGSVIIVFAALAVGLNHSFQNFFVSQTVDTLVRQGQQIAESYARLEGLGGPFWSAQHSQALAQLNNDMRTLSTLGASAIVVDVAGGVHITTADIGQVVLDVEMMRVFEGEMTVQQVPAGELFATATLTVGYPIIINGQIWGAIFMNQPIDEVIAVSSAAMGQVFIALIASAAIIFVLIFITSRTMSRPIRAVSAAAKEIAQGSFGKRLAVSSKDEIGQLAQSFNHMAASLDDIEKTRREFIANISHDLRSPLTSMKGFLQATLDGTINEADRERYLVIVLAETERLVGLADGILELSRAQQHGDGLHIETFDINELLRRAVLMFEARIGAANLDVAADFARERTMVKADREKISRIVHNLLDNAVKFTPPGGRIDVSTQNQGAKVAIAIADTGMGMDEATAGQVFHRFYKADASRGVGAGSGLGLSIVKELVMAHGESISLQSRLGMGSRFSFTLPRVD
ncbi:MAG: HAMP domain-containing histidine kinase [Defluviitaleaceae bacterium]|nr:HAMP domain-containing histidine kinase [Defluviitaleaceae bacterium]